MVASARSIERKGLLSFFLATLIGLSSLSFKELLMPDIAHEWADPTVAISHLCIKQSEDVHSAMLEGLSCGICPRDITRSTLSYRPSVHTERR
ncbi:MAG: hypothetical protein K0S58_2131 [Nitrospira sp.]|nr:hypothetical protein [Nitrospira sp.]